MKKTLYKAGVAAALAAMAYFGNPASAYPQRNPSQIVVDDAPGSQGPRNLIRSRNPSFSATGEGALLKNYVFDIPLRPNSNVSLDSMFELYAVEGGKISYDARQVRRELTKIANDLEGKAIITRKELASVKYIKDLLRQTPESDLRSVSVLERALNDGVLNPTSDSLYQNGQWRIKNGRYGVLARSVKEGQYEPQSILIVVDMKTGMPDTVKTETVKPSIVKQPEIHPPQTDSAKARQDSVMAERKRMAAQEIAKVDSTRKAEKKQAADSVARIPRLNYGFEAAAGINNEVVLGTFFNYPINSRMSLEAFGDIYLARGKSISELSDTTVTFREKELIGPGIYRQRTDVIIGNSKERPIADFGLGYLFKPRKDLELPLRVGVNFSKEERTLYGESTITHERNMEPLGDPQVITNSKEDYERNATNFSFSVGANYSIGKRFFSGTFLENLSSGISFNRTGKNNGARINLKYKF